MRERYHDRSESVGGILMKKKILLTEELATTLLSNNYKSNRHVRPSAVNKLVNDILNNRWDPEVSRFQDPLLVTKDGILINGQHRCFAVIQSGHPIWIYIEDDVPETIFWMLDGGVPRGAADQVNVPNKNNAAALAKIMCAVEDGNSPLASALQGKTNAKTSATRTEIIEKINSENDRIQRFVKAGQSAGIYLFKRKTQIATALFLIEFVGRDDVMERFVHEASQMTTQSQQINALRSFMGKYLTNKTYHPDYKWVVSCVLLAYEAFRNDTEIRQFNKMNAIFSKYDKYVFEARKAKMEVKND